MLFGADLTYTRPIFRSCITDVYENHLDGAPTEDDIEDWFKEAVCHLKSCFGGDQVGIQYLSVVT